MSGPANRCAECGRRPESPRPERPEFEEPAAVSDAIRQATHGYTERGILLVLDEAATISDEVWEQLAERTKGSEWR